jgi:hypothetical protein
MTPDGISVESQEFLSQLLSNLIFKNREASFPNRGFIFKA